jgi:hypothetical protein
VEDKAPKSEDTTSNLQEEEENEDLVSFIENCDRIMVN